MQVNLNMNNIWTTLDFGIMGKNEVQTEKNGTKKDKKINKNAEWSTFFSS